MSYYDGLLLTSSLSYQTRYSKPDIISLASPPQVKPANDIVAELQEYGLTRNEARILVFFAKTGQSKASEVARVVQINRTETYRTIRNLQRRGLVETTLERPVRFQSLPFEKCLQTIVAEKRAELKILEQRGESLLSQFEIMQVEPVAQDVERFQVVESRIRIEQRLQGMYAQAQRSVMAVFSPFELVRADMSGLFDVLARAVRAGLRVRVITAITQSNLEIVEKLHRSIEIRHLDLKAKPIPRVSIIDDKEALFEITRADETCTGGEEGALWINSSAFVRNLQAYFDEMWVTATSAAGMIEAIKKGIQPDEVRILKDRPEVSGKLNAMIASGKQSVEIWTTMRGVQTLAYFHLNALKEAKARRVKIRVIAPITSENTESARKLVPVSELRYSEGLGQAGIAIVDQRELMLYERIPDDKSPNVGADIGFWTNSKRFIETMSKAYDAMWKGVFAVYKPRRRGLK